MYSQAIANHLQVSVSQIVRIEKWKNCLFVIVRGVGARFVSYSVLKNAVSALVRIGGKAWKKTYYHRVYFSDSVIAKALGLPTQAIAQIQGKFFFDVPTGVFSQHVGVIAHGVTDRDLSGCLYWVEAIKRLVA